MRIIRDLQHCPVKGAAIALGNFDGVHAGHRSILQHCIDTARAQHIPAAVMTFEPHPREFFGGQMLRLEPLAGKLRRFEAMGIDAVLLVRFNAAFAAMTAQDFIETLLHRTLQARHVFTGENFAFGAKRSGDTAMLAGEANRLGFGYTACPPVCNADGEWISSSAIRNHLAAGQVAQASALLGRPYSIEGVVRRGQQRGRELGFPTANLSLGRLFRPRFGVYAARVTVDGTPHNAAVSLGINPTFALDAPVLEAHLLDGEHSLYGKRIRVELLYFLRDEKRFDNVQDLAVQMRVDCTQAQELLGSSCATFT